MIIRQSVSLRYHNSLRLFGEAANYTKIHDITEFSEFRRLIPKYEGMIRVLGNGTGILLTGNVEGLTVINRMRGLDKVREDEDSVTIGVNSGELWDKLVEQMIKNRYYGFENLSGLDGTVAGAVIRNFEQFGLRIGDFVESVITIDLQTGQERKFTREDCAFDYHKSVFNSELKGKYYIYRVLFRIPKKSEMKVNYREIKQGLMTAESGDPTPELIREIVIRIQRSRKPGFKFPNAGPVFRNPIVDSDTGNKLKQEFPDIVLNSIGEGKFKIPAGWLIQKAGWTGRKMGDAGVYKRNPAVFLNLGNAKTMDFLVLINAVKTDIAEKFGITLEEELERI